LKAEFIAIAIMLRETETTTNAAVAAGGVVMTNHTLGSLNASGVSKNLCRARSAKSARALSRPLFF
jgi:hypothetical protein